MIGHKGHPEVEGTMGQIEKKSPDASKPSYLDVASKSLYQDATSLLLQLKSQAQASDIEDEKQPNYSIGTSDKVNFLKPPHKTFTFTFTFTFHQPPYSNKKGGKWMHKTYYATGTSIIWKYETIVI